MFLEKHIVLTVELEMRDLLRRAGAKIESGFADTNFIICVSDYTPDAEIPASIQCRYAAYQFACPITRNIPMIRERQGLFLLAL